MEHSFTVSLLRRMTVETAVRCVTQYARRVRIIIRNIEDTMFAVEKLGPAAFLMAHGYKFTGVQPHRNPRRTRILVFLFEDPGGTAEQDLERFYAGGQVIAQAYERALQKLKIVLHEHGAVRFQPRSPEGLTPNVGGGK